MADLFDIQQKEGESLQDFLNRFCGVMIKINSPSEEMFIEAFKKGLRANPFSESLLREKPKTIVEVLRRATTHMDAEETMKQKRFEERCTLVKSQPLPDIPRGDTRDFKRMNVIMYHKRRQDLVRIRRHLRQG